MNQVLSKEQLQELKAKHPVIMTRREKLLHWADLVEKQPNSLRMFDRMELWTQSQLEDPVSYRLAYPEYLEQSAFGVAAADPDFKAAGLESNTPAAAMKFFELTQGQLHEFSCYCGGQITNTDMAARIRNLAG